MAIIGFIVCGILLIYFSLAWAAVAFNTLGKYNIGGVPNTYKDKIFTLVLLCVLAFGWIALFENAPFTVTVAAHGIKE